jgi:hypothetical protein
MTITVPAWVAVLMILACAAVIYIAVFLPLIDAAISAGHRRVRRRAIAKSGMTEQELDEQLARIQNEAERLRREARRWR